MISVGEEDVDEEAQRGANRARLTKGHPREWYGNLVWSRVLFFFTYLLNLIVERFYEIHSINRAYLYVSCAELS